MSLPDPISFVADICSVVGLVITIYVARATSKIKMSLLNRVRIPQTRQDLQQLVNGLTALLAEWPKYENDAYVHLSKISGILANLKPRVSGQLRKETDSLIKQMGEGADLRRARSDHSPENRLDMIWEVISSLHRIIEMLNQLVKDYRKGLDA